MLRVLEVAALVVLVLPDEVRARFWQALSDLVLGRPPDADAVKDRAVAVLEEEARLARAAGRPNRARELERIARRLRADVVVS